MSLAQDCLGKLTEEAVHTRAYLEDTPRVTQALEDLEADFAKDFLDQSLLSEALKKSQRRATERLERHEATVKISPTML